MAGSGGTELLSRHARHELSRAHADRRSASSRRSILRGLRALRGGICRPPGTLENKPDTEAESEGLLARAPRAAASARVRPEHTRTVAARPDGRRPATRGASVLTRMPCSRAGCRARLHDREIPWPHRADGFPKLFDVSAGLRGAAPRQPCSLSGKNLETQRMASMFRDSRRYDTSSLVARGAG